MDSTALVLFASFGLCASAQLLRNAVSNADMLFRKDMIALRPRKKMETSHTHDGNDMCHPPNNIYQLIYPTLHLHSTPVSVA